MRILVKASRLLYHAAVRKMSKSSNIEVFSPFQENSLCEKCIIVDEMDNALGSATKLDCHKVQNDGSLILHRAFSLFIFNSKGEMLLQQRSPNKITFPLYFANACCSHPLYEIKQERNEIDALGVKCAAQRRIQIELGIPKDQTTLNDFHYITRIIYKSRDNIEWGEYELDYILFLVKDVDIVPNPEEVSMIKFVSQKDFGNFVSTLKYPLSPWLELCAKYFLHKWWNNLSNLNQIKDHDNIYKLT